MSASGRAAINNDHAISRERQRKTQIDSCAREISCSTRISLPDHFCPELKRDSPSMALIEWGASWKAILHLEPIPGREVSHVHVLMIAENPAQASAPMTTDCPDLNTHGTPRGRF